MLTDTSRKKISTFTSEYMFECFKYKMRRLWVLQKVLYAFTNKPGTSILIYQGLFYGVGLAHYGREISLSKSHELIVEGIVMSWIFRCLKLSQLNKSYKLLKI